MRISKISITPYLVAVLLSASPYSRATVLQASYTNPVVLTDIYLRSFISAPYSVTFQYDTNSEKLYLTSLTLGACSASLSTPLLLGIGLSKPNSYNPIITCGPGTTWTPDLTAQVNIKPAGSVAFTDSGTYSFRAYPAAPVGTYTYAVNQPSLSLFPLPSSASVPAPPSWLMMLTGLALMVPLYRRYRRKQE